MNGEQAIHPARDTLAAYGLGKLPPAEAVAVESHIAECQECCETLLDLGSDTFADLVRRSDAVELESVTGERTIGSHEAGSETVGNLPDELTEHPRYRVLELLGKGGMGDVYKAEHSLMNRSVALKVINRELVQNDQAIERFRREVQSAAQLAHPNIVTAYDAEQAGDLHFLVMEYVPGDDLSDVVKRDGPLDVTQACDYIQQAANGLQHACSKGMVHRDVKPHNLMVTAEGHVKILDFGLAALAAEPLGKDAVDHVVEHESNGRRTPNLTTAGSMMGTPDFISPEQATDARAADIRSDIYSLGCTFYYLLTGRPPFTEGSALERVKAHGEMDPEPIENFRGDISPELAEIVHRMMAKQPAERFQTPADVADALAPFIDANRAMPVMGQQTGTRKRTASSRRSWWPPTIVQSLAFGAFAFVLSGVIYVATDNGTLVVESEDENVEIIIRPAIGDAKEEPESNAQMRIVDTVTGSTVKRLRSGEYVLDLKGDQNEYELDKDRLVLKRGGEVVVTVARRKDAREPTARLVWEEAKDWTFSGKPSPDGRFLTYVDWDTGNLGLHDFKSGQDRLLTNDGCPEQAWNSVFSPDGQRIAYVCRVGTSTELRFIGIDESEPRTLYDRDDWITPTAWSPNGDWISAFVSLRKQYDDVALVSAHDGSLRTLAAYKGTQHAWMSFSPDSRYLACTFNQEQDFERGRSNGDVFVLATDGSGKYPVIEHPANDFAIGWSSDGKRLLFASDRTGSGRRGLLQINVTSSDVAILAEGRIFDCDWSPDGKTVYYEIREIRDDADVWKLVRRDLDSGMETELCPSGRIERLTTSPSGRELAFLKSGINIISVDGGEPSKLLDKKGISSLAWSPDGRFLIFVIASEQQSELWRIAVEGGEAEKVGLSVTGNMNHLCIHPDGQQIAYNHSEDKTQVWVMDNLLPPEGRNQP